MAKKIIFSLLAICLIAGMVGVGTWAYFSDIETSPGQRFQAGTLDLTVSGENPLARTFFTVGNIAPGDWEQQLITLSNIGSLDGSAYIHIIRTMDDENEAWEPELDPLVTDPVDVEDDLQDPFDGELGQNLLLTITADEKLVAKDFLFVPAAALPEIDGALAPGEWDGATVIDVAGTEYEGASMGTVSVLAYADYLYVLFDVLDSTDGRTGGRNDKIGLNINPTPGGPWGKPYDIVFQTGADPAAFTTVPPGGVSSGMSDGWETEWVINGTQLLSLPAGLETKTVYDYDTGTRISEWKVPLATIAPSPGDTLKVGGACDNLNVGGGSDGGTFSYPPGLLWDDEATYVPLTLPPLRGLDCVVWDIGALKAGSSIDLMIRWDVPGGVGNIIQSDICEFDIEFTLLQGIAKLDADFTYAPAEPGLGEVITFTDMTRGGVAPYSYEWDFDEDGVADKTEANPTWSWPDAGDYPVTLTVTDDEGTVDTETKTVTVKDMPPVITNLTPESGATIDIGETVLVTAWVWDDVELLLIEVLPDVWVESVGFAIDDPAAEPNLMLRQNGNIFAGQWDTSLESAGPHTIYVLAVDNRATPEDFLPYLSVCPTPVTLVMPEWWEFEYEALGTTTMWQSIGGVEPDPPEPSTSPSGYELWVSTATYMESAEYRELFIPQDSYWSTPTYSLGDAPLKWVTIELVMLDDGDGRLYIDSMSDVDVAGETTEAGTALTWGDTVLDPAGSAWVHMSLQANVYNQPGDEPDMEDPETWGSMFMEVPLDMYLTTASSSNHVTDTPEGLTPGVYLTCSTVTASGVPFAELGGPAPYVGTGAELAASGAVLDLIAMGFLELDVQFTSVSVLTPAP